jgi:hypothetical protein
MRTALAVLLVLTLRADALAQTRAGLHPGTGLPKFKLTRTNGDTFCIVSYEKKGPFYVVTDRDGKVTQHFEGSVKSIVPLSEEEAIACLKEVEARTPSVLVPQARRAARTEARSAARVDPPQPREEQASARSRTSAPSFASYGASHLCGAPTRSGGSCMRLVRGPGYCWQHR